MTYALALAKKCVRECGELSGPDVCEIARAINEALAHERERCAFMADLQGATLAGHAIRALGPEEVP